MKKLMILACLLIYSICSFAVPTSINTAKIKHVIYITFDGVRWQDIFLDPERLPIFWKKYAHQMTLYGLPNANSPIQVASVPISLPSYQSQMAGKIQPCFHNICGRITVETFPEFLKKSLKLNKKDIAVFGSWYEIDYAAQHIEGSIFSNTGNSPVYDPDTNTPDEVMVQLNLEQLKDYPTLLSRYDKYTFAQAIHYFEKYQPIFMWLSLNDSDENAHHGNLEGYRNALKFYDTVIDNLFEKLTALNLKDETLVIITTDHGRGNGDHWTSHGVFFPESKQTWGFVWNGTLVPENIDKNLYSTLSIRPTVELALKTMHVNLI